MDLWVPFMGGRNESGVGPVRVESIFCLWALLYKRNVYEAVFTAGASNTEQEEGDKGGENNADRERESWPCGKAGRSQEGRFQALLTVCNLLWILQSV